MTRLLIAELLAMLLAAGCATVAEDAPLPATTHTLSVAEFGATPDDAKDDTAAVREALAAAAKRPGTRLVFPEGRYDFAAAHRPAKTRYQLELAGARNVVIDGQGSKLMFEGRTAALYTRDCEDVAVVNLTIDWPDPLFSAGLITRADGKSFDIALTREYTGEGSERVESIIEFDPKTHAPMRGGRDIHDLPRNPNPLIGKIERTGEKMLRVHVRRSRFMTEGALAILRHQVYVYNAFTVHDCKRFTLRDVTVHYAPGMGVSGKRIEDVTLKRVRMVPPPKSDRVLSISSDGTHFSACSGTVTIEDCEFQGMGDDATNVHGFYLDVTRKIDDRTLEAKCKETWSWPPGVGNVMELTDPLSLKPYATARVKSVVVEGRPRIHRIAFDQPLPKTLKLGHYLANATRVPKVRIRNNTVTRNRARGFVVKTRDAIVENNVFDGVSGAAVFVAVEGDHWRESIATRDVVVRNNVIRDCNSGPSRRWAAVCVFALTEGGRQGDVGVHRNVTIANNVIERSDNAAMFVSSADGVRITGNVITACSRKPSRKGGDSAVYLMKCRNVTLRGNVLKRPGERFGQAVGFGPEVDKDTLIVDSNRGF